MEVSKQQILVTGSGGLLGWHVRAFLSTKEDIQVIPCDHQQFNDSTYLDDCVSQADAVIHLAGVNRGEDEQVATNAEIAQQMIDACMRTRRTPHIIYSNSTHVDKDTVYGNAKREAAAKFQAWAATNSARFSNVILPHIFGEHGRPFYNSVVSTFCHQVANGLSPEIQVDGTLNLLHAQEAAVLFLQLFQNGETGDCRPDGVPMLVSEFLNRLNSLHKRYRDEGVVPDVSDVIDLRLFNTYRSYIPHEERPRRLELWSDDRGSLFEAVRADGRGQIFMSSTHPGITRGEHFHFGKVERFLVVSGKARIRLRRVLHDEVYCFDVDGNELSAIDIPTLHTHNITNIGDEPLTTLFWTSEHFDKQNPDTFAMKVESEGHQDTAVSNNG